MGLITAERRAFLRHLKAAFDEAFDKIESVEDRSHATYLAAEEAYKVWRKAIDADAIALVEDIETLEEENEKLRRQNFDLVPTTPAPDPRPPLQQSEIDRIFNEIDHMSMLQEAISLLE